MHVHTRRNRETDTQSDTWMHIKTDSNRQADELTDTNTNSVDRMLSQNYGGNHFTSHCCPMSLQMSDSLHYRSNWLMMRCI